MTFHGTPGTPESELRVDEALKLIERAQHDLEAACAELSAIAGGAEVLWRRTSTLGMKVHELWEALAYRDRRRWHLTDEDAVDGILPRLGDRHRRRKAAR